MLLFLVFAFTAVTAIYSFYAWHAGYWKRRGIPGPPPKLFFGNFLEMDKLEKPAVLVFPEWTKKYGKVFGVQEGIRKVLVISDLDMLQELFVRKFDHFHGRKMMPMAPNPDTDPRIHVFNARGARWKRLRVLTNPSFSVNSLKKMRHTVEDSAKVLLGHMEKHANTGKGFDIHKFYQEYTMDVIARVAMGQKGSRQFDNPAVALVLETFMRRVDSPIFYWILGTPFWAEITRKLFVMTAQLRGSPFLKVIKLIESAVEERRRQRSAQTEWHEPNDFIDLFLDAEAEVELDGKEIDKNYVKVERKLGNQEIVAQCFVFLLAGFDTTANSLSYVTYLLATHPEKLERVVEELDQVLGDEKEFTYDMLNELKYLDNVVKEGLRMYPLGAFANSRTCMKPTTLGNVEVEEGTLVVSDPWTIHYDKEIWGRDADEFVPERWDEERPRHLLAWFPFGVGPRQCIGMRLAFLEEKMAIAHLLRNYTISAGAETEKKLNLIGNFTVSPASVTIYLNKREKH
ncbi:unnamed protein product, partial [Mesorhabditis spiculigera]